MSTTTQTLTIRIELTPDSCLSPNQTKGKHWADRTIKKAENDLVMATWSAFHEGHVEVTGYIEPPLDVFITVYWEKGRKRMDGDNLLAALKRGCIDQIARDIAVNDKSFRFQPIEQTRDPDGRGYMIVTLQEGATHAHD